VRSRLPATVVARSSRTARPGRPRRALAALLGGVCLCLAGAAGAGADTIDLLNQPSLRLDGPAPERQRRLVVGSSATRTATAAPTS